MKYFIKKLLILLIPIYLYAILIVVIDPFTFFNITTFIDLKTKISVNFRTAKTAMLGTMLLKLNDFKHNPQDKIILGASRAYHIRTDAVEEITGDRFYNLAVPGSDFRAIYDMFWYANQQIQLKKVYVALTFMYYNQGNKKKDLYKEASDINRQVFPFFTDNLLIEQAYYVADRYFSTFSHKKPKSSPIKSKENKKSPSKQQEQNNQTKWNNKLKYLDRVFKKYKYPEENIDQLNQIANFCRDKQIELTFVVFPDHSDVREIRVKHGLEDDVDMFKKDILKVGDLIDFNYENNLTANKDIYKDPVHLSYKQYHKLYHEIFLKDVDRNYSVLYKKTGY